MVVDAIIKGQPAFFIFLHQIDSGPCFGISPLICPRGTFIIYWDHKEKLMVTYGVWSSVRH